MRNAPAVSLVIRHCDHSGGPVLLGRRAHEPYLGCWELTGGFVNLGEHPTDAAIREAGEELGISVVLRGLVGTSVVRAARRDDWLQITTYVADTADEPRPDGTEVSEARWFALEATPEIMAGDHAERLERYRQGRWSDLDVSGLRP